jgi:hypothetical protein
VLRLVGVVCLAIGVACGGVPTEAGEPDVFGARVVVESSAPFTTAADFRPRLRRSLEQTARYFGHDLSEFADLRITVTDVVDPAQPSVGGEFNPETNTVRVAVLPGTAACVEDLTLPHEALHFFLRGAPLYGDPGHTDPRWSSVLALMQQIGFGRCD